MEEIKNKQNFPETKKAISKLSNQIKSVWLAFIIIFALILIFAFFGTPELIIILVPVMILFGFTAIFLSFAKNKLQGELEVWEQNKE